MQNQYKEENLSYKWKITIIPSIMLKAIIIYLFLNTLAIIAKKTKMQNNHKDPGGLTPNRLGIFIKINILIEEFMNNNK